MKYIIIPVLSVFLLGCAQEENVEHEVASDSSVLDSTLVSSDTSKPNKMTEILKRFDDRNQDLLQQQQISEEARYDSNIYREITRLNN